MPRDKIPGVYMIRNKINGKIYIGQSTDVPNRFKKYMWAVNNPEATYRETIRDIIKEMREEGLNNFEFTILETGEKYKDVKHRLKREKALISMYDCMHPKGYNRSAGGEFGPISPRDQSFLEKMKRAKSVWLYDTKKNSLKLFFSGAKGVGDLLGYGKDVMSHTVNRGSILEDRYYIIPAKYSDRMKLLEKLRYKKVINAHETRRAKSHSTNAYYKYESIVKLINEIEEHNKH